MISREIYSGFEQVGMRKVALKFTVPLFSPDAGDYIRFFAPHVIRKRGEARVLGTFGLMFLPFEKFWQKDHNNTTLMISLYASNIEFLMSPPDMNRSDKEVRYDWFSKIRMGVDLFPLSLAEFLLGVSRGGIGAFPLETVTGDRSKFYAFLQWARDRNVQDSQ